MSITSFPAAAGGRCEFALALGMDFGWRPSTRSRGHGGTYRLYYRGLPKVEHDTGWESLCCAESKDGIHWRKPDLGILEVRGARESNVIITNSEPGTCSFSPFLDAKPSVPAADRFKALGLYPKSAGWFVITNKGFHKGGPL